MNYFDFMKINDYAKFPFLNYFVACIFAPNMCHPIPSSPFFIHTLGSANQGLKVFILFDAYVGVAWNVPNGPRLDAQDL
jgi:hypothetical protein